ncbi:AraC family transcriptional regulator [Dyella sp. RRB7]|uniref:helix-turn-helix transcriptional regulator n=1 Tax=Dyella sp. RRB7 TaxID=2919502 RepID=UPI001FA9BBC0|nr:AraC family transcriptional regulator [Dyella sp. RRB7]
MTIESVTRSSSVRNLISIDEILHARPQMPMTSTRGRGWNGVTVDVHRAYSKVGESYAGLDHHMVHYCPSGSAKLTQIRGGGVHSSLIKAGHTIIMPAGYPSSWEGDVAPSARLRVPTSLIAAAAEQLGQHVVTQVEIRNVFEVFDPIIGRLVQTFIAEMELEPHPCQILIVDALSTAIAAHLIRRYNIFGVVEVERTRSLGRLEMTRLTAFVEDNLHRSISLDELANLVNVSRFHFCRIFKQSTGTTAFSFVEQCRIRRAQVLIIETSLSLAEVSLMAGFADQSHFTRRFHFHVGCTPAAFAREHGRRRSTRRETLPN